MTSGSPRRIVALTRVFLVLLLVVPQYLENVRIRSTLHVATTGRNFFRTRLANVSRGLREDRFSCVRDLRGGNVADTRYAFKNLRSFDNPVDSRQT